MACFIVPGTEAIVTTAITKIVEKKEKKEICSCETEGAVEAVKEEKVLPFSRKLRWLNNMLWGGTALLAFEHVWHGEVTPFFPFLTAAGNAQDTLSQDSGLRKQLRKQKLKDWRDNYDITYSCIRSGYNYYYMVY